VSTYNRVVAADETASLAPTVLTQLATDLSDTFAPLTSSRNLLINSNFAVNQSAYVSATDLALNAYGLDMWKATTATSRMTFTAAPQGQTVTIAAGDSFGQVVERANVTAGSHILSWPGTAEARVYNVGGSAPSYAASPITVTLDGLADVLAEFGPGTVGQVQLERGTVATPYQPPMYADNLAKCQRYYETGSAKVFVNDATGVALATNFKVTKRAAPTMAYSTASDRTYLPGSTEWVDEQGFSVYRAAREVGFVWSANARL